MPRPPGALLSCRLTAVTLALLRFVFRRVSRIYFRSVEVAGDVPSVSTGSRIFCGNHVNALLDPVLILLAAPCAVSPIGKSTLWKIPVLKNLLDAVGAVPIVRRTDDPTKAQGANDEVFAKVSAHLVKGGNLLIFPEGTSHNEPHLLKLRSGAGHMLARAYREGAEGASFQAVALEFDARDTFRSRALVLFGPVRRADEFREEGDALAKAIVAKLAQDLSELLVEGDSWEELRLVLRVAELYAAEEGDASLEAKNRLGRRVEAAKRFLATADPEELGRVKAAIAHYFDALDAKGLQDTHVTSGRLGRPSAWALLLLPLALFGMALYALPYQVPRVVVRRLGGTADVSSTYKLGVGLLVFPLWAAALCVAGFSFLPAALAALFCAGVLLSPFPALAWLDRIDAHGSLGRALLPARATARELTELARERSALRSLLESMRERVEVTAP
jgi:glycerol-3-phosphate O-acyltransferase/dihydroxyacetone phosphate acyltransferase